MDLPRKLVREYGDLLVVVGVVGLGLIEAVTDSRLSALQQLATVVALLVLGVLLVARRRIPLVLLGLMLIGALAEPWTGESGSGQGEVFGLISVVAVYNAAAHTDGRRMWVAAALTGVFATAVLVNDPDNVDLGGILFFTLLFATPWTVGRVIRQRRLREAQLEREKAEAEAAIAEERSRIARELHDVVAHAISVIVLQARGGRKLLDNEPEETRQALDAIERSGARRDAETPRAATRERRAARPCAAADARASRRSGGPGARGWAPGRAHR